MAINCGGQGPSTSLGNLSQIPPLSTRSALVINYAHNTYACNCSSVINFPVYELAATTEVIKTSQTVVPCSQEIAAWAEGPCVQGISPAGRPAHASRGGGDKWGELTLAVLWAAPMYPTGGDKWGNRKLGSTVK